MNVISILIGAILHDVLISLTLKWFKKRRKKSADELNNISIIYKTFCYIYKLSLHKIQCIPVPTSLYTMRNSYCS